MRRRFAVVGGGIAGLAAALDLVRDADVLLLEAGDRLGGKIRTGSDGVEDGAEQFLMRDTATGGASGAARLAQALDLPIIHPATSSAGLYTRGTLRPLPAGTVMGIPADGLDGFAIDSGKDIDTGAPVLPAREDVTVGRLVRERLGDDIVDRLVDPLLGGVYAGRADELSLATTMPGLHTLLQTHHTLRSAVGSAQELSKAHNTLAGPVFGSVEGGLSRLVEAAADELTRAGGEIRLGCRVTAVRRTDHAGLEILTPDGWVVVDGLILAVPATPAARLLTFLAPEASGDVAALDYASVGLVMLALPECELPVLSGTQLSGFLVPAGEGPQIKAATFLSRKWPTSTPETIVRASLGRHGDSVVLHGADADLADLVRGEISAIIGTQLPAPLRSRVTRWGGGLPQYAPGHLDRVAAARAALTDLPIALAGAAYDGVGIPACITSGERAATRLRESLV
jgi:oxygen-dependent protoporphyrinogen oxidase